MPWLEIWKTIPEFPAYEVSCWARVRKGRKILSTWDKDGYRKVTLCAAGRKANRFVHVLVAEAFRGPRPPGHEALHKNGNRRHCWLPNVDWGTRRENHDDKRRHGTFLVDCSVKLNPRRVRALRKTQNWKKLADRFRVTRRAAANARNGTTWGKVG